jgi:hypothetical protein
MQDYMDWLANAKAKPTEHQPGLMNEGPPGQGPAPVRGEFDFAEYQDSPWYTHGLDQGINAIERSAVGQGNLYSGATGKALNQFGQDYGMSKYNEARKMHNIEGQDDYNRWLQTSNFDLNKWLQSELNPSQWMTELGYGAAQGQGNLGTNQNDIRNARGQNDAQNALSQGNISADLYGSYGDSAGNLLGAGTELAKLLGSLF